MREFAWLLIVVAGLCWPWASGPQTADFRWPGYHAMWNDLADQPSAAASPGSALAPLPIVPGPAAVAIRAAATSPDRTRGSKRSLAFALLPFATYAVFGPDHVDVGSNFVLAISGSDGITLANVVSTALRHAW